MPGLSRISIFDSAFAATKLFGMSVIAHHFDFKEWGSYGSLMLTHKEIGKTDDNSFRFVWDLNLLL